MFVECVLDLDGRDVLAARNDDVLGAVLDLDVAVRLHDGEVAGVVPAAAEGVCGCVRVLEVTLHHEVAAEHDLAHGFTVPGHRLHGIGVHHRDAFLSVVAHALAPVQCDLFCQRQVAPLVVLGAHGCRPIGFGEPIYVGDVEADPCHAFDHRGRWRCCSDETGNLVVDALAPLFGGVGQH